MCVACGAPLSMDEVCETLTPEVAVFQQPRLAAVGVSGAPQHAIGFDEKNYGVLFKYITDLCGSTQHRTHFIYSNFSSFISALNTRSLGDHCQFLKLDRIFLRLS